mmetsp:Transcript_11134/g.22028  ORF Transcript_11134/g.22028 Transcript_11134/m.22028 type:complete len:194 (-) Transcript_11134:193-774(-)|eukprot:CAMPEP_0194323884 /NCGR_PEP_ID=MMETSP0171-20130528/26018_1 /TAXON_ID=218684 /ORGANISM="Corethron pennatum, Strain L29A3" /LENGTH=193 /DNA_ID=CAMNT_0039082627 /DNA_START=116 /DNA_END=697 /DNA_ORIENTATION=+
MDNPSWSNPSGSTAPAASNAAVPTGNAVATTTGGAGVSGKSAQRLLSVYNLATASLMAATGFIIIVDLILNRKRDGVDPSNTIEGFYMILLSLLLGSYEILWWMPLPWLNKSLRKNFGFMYHMWGKTAYLVFAACLFFSLLDSKAKWPNTTYWLAIASGIVLGAGALVHVMVLCKYKDLANSYTSPTVGLDTV